MSSKFRNSVAVLAVLTGLGTAAFAQTAPATPEATTPEAAPAAPATPAAPVAITADTLPDLLKSLNLQNIDIDQERRHTEVEGNLADGTQIEAVLDDQGQLRKIEADDDAALPAQVIEALVPEAVRGAALYADFASIDEIGIPPADAPMQGVMLEGKDATGEDLRAMFAEDGTLTRFGRGDDDRDERHGKRGGHGEHGGPGKHGKHGDHGPRGERGGDHGPRGGDHAGGPGAGQPPAPLDQAVVTTTLTEAGYTDLGTVTQDGPRTLVEAVNAAGENVTVELNPRGEVTRETAR